MARKDSSGGSDRLLKTGYVRMLTALLGISAAVMLLAGGCGSDTGATAAAEVSAATEDSATAEDDASMGDSADTGDSTDSGDASQETAGTDTADASQKTEDTDETGASGGKKSASSLTYKQKLTYIMNHKKQYPKRYRQLAKQYPETIDFVYNYPELHDTDSEIDLSEEAASASIPLLIQWDERWGYESYGDGDIGYTGCGPTCLSMVALYLTGNEKYTPLYIAKYADANGYYSEGSGTLWLLMTKGAKAFGLTASEVDTDEAALKQLVKSGCPVICSVGKGDFTDSGHFIVLTGYAKGKFTLHDPNSVENSEKTWSYKRLAKQIRTSWSYQASGGTDDSGAAG